MLLSVHRSTTKPIAGLVDMLDGNPSEHATPSEMGL
jgi:hypothetical protein